MSGVSALAPVDLPTASPTRRRLTTPGWLRALAVCTILAAIVFGVLVAATLGAEHTDFAQIGDRSAPQVEANSDLYFVLADLDAQAANVLLSGDDPSLAADRTSSLAEYDNRRKQADADLQQVVQTGSDKAATLRLLDQFGHYQALAGEALWLNGHPGDPAGRPSTTALDLYRQATDQMRAMLVTAQTLVTDNHDALNTAYTAAYGDTGTDLPWIIAGGLLTLLLLIGLQLFLGRRLRRRINPALVIATALALAMTATTTVLLTDTAHQLTVAKQNAFDSIIALSQARSISYDANADESRYLVDPGRAAQYQQAFVTKTAAVRADFTTELHNITFPASAPRPSKPLPRTRSTRTTTDIYAPWPPRATCTAPSRSTSARTSASRTTRSPSTTAR